MATTEIKTIEKLVKEILEKVKNIGEQNSQGDLGEAFEKINTKLETIDERLCVPNANENISAEIISKVEKLDEKTQDYLKEIQTAFENFKKNQSEILSEEVDETSDIKDFMLVITNELSELKTQFENFNTEFTDININTGMAVSKEIISLKNHVLALNDSVENIKKEFGKIKPKEDDFKLTEEMFNTSFNNFKNDVYSVLAKITDTSNDNLQKISDLSDELKTFEGLEMSIGEVIENQQKNKTEILKVFQNNIEEENKKLLPQIMQLINSISFDESAEDIKDGIFTVNENLNTVNSNIETNSKTTGKILGKVDDISKRLKKPNTELKTLVKDSYKELMTLIKNTSGDVKTFVKDSDDEILNLIKGNEEAIKTFLKDNNEEIKNSFKGNGEEIQTYLKDNNEEIKTYIKDSNDGIVNLVKQDLVDKLTQMNMFLSDVSNDFALLTKGTKGDSDNYLYSLLDLESDISKVRVILDELNNTIQDDRSLAKSVTKNISDKISNISSFVEQTALLYTSPDYKEILSQFDALNDDITSISKRTNKLILTSDDASEKLQKNIEDFQNIMVKISETVKSFENSAVLKNLGAKTDNIQKLLLNSIQSDKAINEAFVYLANWVDITSEEIKNIKNDLAYIKNLFKDNTKTEKDESYNSVKIEKYLKETNKKLDENIKKIDLLEERINENAAIMSTLEFVSAQVQVINDTFNTKCKKLDKMEKQIQKLLSYVEEDEE